MVLDLGSMLSAFNLLFGDMTNWLVIIPGMILGLTFAAIPGLTGSMAMAIVLPATFYMDFIPAILLLSAIFTGGNFGGAVPAVLINIPGCPAAVATTFDGYPMCLQGKHNEALGIALSASCAGSFLSYIILLFAARPLGRLVMFLGPTEMFMIILWGLTLIASLSGRSVLRGLLAGLFGILVGTIGFSGQGVIRGTLGIPYLLDGIPPVPAMIGLFASAEFFYLMDAKYIITNEAFRKLSLSRIFDGITFPFRKEKIALLRGSIVGILIGACPGVGSAVACLVSYNQGRRTDKHPETFGKGNPKGVVVAESADSSSEGGSMATMFSLGIPGSGATAMMLAVFAMHNVTGGPRFMAVHMDWVYAIIFSNFGQVFLLFVMGLLLIYSAASIVTIPTMIIIPTITVLAFLGAFALTNSFYGPVVMLVFAVIGWWMKRYDYSAPAAVVGIILGRIADNELLRSYQLGGGDLTILFTRPISGGLFLMIVLLLFYSAIKTSRKKVVASQEPIG